MKLFSDAHLMWLLLVELTQHNFKVSDRHVEYIKCQKHQYEQPEIKNVSFLIYEVVVSLLADSKTKHKHKQNVIPRKKDTEKQIKTTQ